MGVFLGILGTAIPQLPTIIIWIVGIILAFTRRDEHPQKYMLAIIGFVIFIVLSILQTITTVAIPVSLIQNGANTQQAGAILSLLSIGYGIGHMIAWVCILITLFQHRVVRDSTLHGSRAAITGSADGDYLRTTDAS